MSCALAGKQSRRVRLYFRSEEKEDALPQSWIMNHDNYIYIYNFNLWSTYPEIFQSKSNSIAHCLFAVFASGSSMQVCRHSTDRFCFCTRGL
jgi:hypothetical protein